jgi:hypothetical protein
MRRHTFTFSKKEALELIDYVFYDAEDVIHTEEGTKNTSDDYGGDETTLDVFAAANLRAKCFNCEQEGHTHASCTTPRTTKGQHRIEIFEKKIDELKKKEHHLNSMKKAAQDENQKHSDGGDADADINAQEGSATAVWADAALHDGLGTFETTVNSGLIGQVTRAPDNVGISPFCGPDGQQFTDDEVYDLRHRWPNPPLRGTRRTPDNIKRVAEKEAIRQLEGLPVAPAFAERHKRTCAAVEGVGDGFRTETPLVIFGLLVTGVLLDSGAQFNLITIGSLFSLAHLHKGAGFMAALRSALWNTADRPGHSVYGIGGLKMPLLGYVNLSITAGGKEIEVPFAITKEGSDMIIVGTPGLRALNFTLKSPFFKNVNFLQPPKLRRSEQDEATRVEASANQAPSIAPKLDKYLPTKAPAAKKGGNKKKKAVKSSAVMGPSGATREQPSCSTDAPLKGGGQVKQKRADRAPRKTTPKAAKDATAEATTTQTKEKTSSGRAAGRRKNAKPVEDVDKAKSVLRHSDRVKCENELKKDALNLVLEKHAHVQIEDNGNIVPAAPVFQKGDKGATTRLKC